MRTIEISDFNAADKDSKKCILTKEACEELIKRFSVIYIKEDEQAKNDRVDSHL